MNNRKTVIVIGILFTLAIFVLAKTLINKNKPTPEDLHYHAGFIVYENGTKIDFSDLKYMNIEPCQLHSEDNNETPEHRQLEKAHLHDRVGDVVHVHRQDAVWGDLFTNLKYPLDYSKSVAYVNGTKVENFKDFPIKSYDNAIIFMGNFDESLLNTAVTLEHIKEVESKSESCGT